MGHPKSLESGVNLVTIDQRIAARGIFGESYFGSRRLSSGCNVESKVLRDESNPRPVHITLLLSNQGLCAPRGRDRSSTWRDRSASPCATKLILYSHTPWRPFVDQSLEYSMMRENLYERFFSASVYT
jgi:hypothetical protein